MYSYGLAANRNGFTSVSNPGKVAVVFMTIFLSSGLNIGGKLAAVFGAGFAGMRCVRHKCAARVLPDATALIPMEAQTVKGVRGGAMAGLRKFQPYPFADNLGKLVLAGQFPFQQSQNLLRRQFTVGVVLEGNPFRAV